jgi:UDP-N-acetylglucosamine 3-dehydrogenase
MTRAHCPVRLAILGAGTIGTIHGLASLETPDVEVTRVWSRSADGAQALARSLGARACPTVEEALDSGAVDAAVVATPTFMHEEHALAAIAAGLHVICEKPLARDLSAAQRMVDAAEAAGVWLLSAHVVRLFPDFGRLHAAIREGRVGHPAVARMSRAASFPHGRDEWHSKPELSGGVVLDMALHDLDWLLWTLGPAERVYARGLYGKGTPFLDYALITVRHQSGCIAHVEASWAETGGFRVHGEIAGDGGLLTYDSRTSAAFDLELRSPPDTPPGVTVPGALTTKSPYVLQLERMTQTIRGEEPPLTTSDEALATLRLSLAALESIETGQPVTP